MYRTLSYQVALSGWQAVPLNWGFWKSWKIEVLISGDQIFQGKREQKEMTRQALRRLWPKRLPKGLENVDYRVFASCQEEHSCGKMGHIPIVTWGG